MDDFWEFINYVDDEPYINVPRVILRDNSNPFEIYTNNELLQRIRFTREIVNTIILPMVYPVIRMRDNRGVAIPFTIKIYIALRYYASGSYQRVCGDIVKISQASVCRVIIEVSEALARNLRNYIKFPEDMNGFRQLKQTMYNIAHFPGVIGCVDGTHIEIKSPGGQNGEIYRNRKGWMSLNIQVVNGPRCEILDIVIRWPGSAHDSRIFNSSSLKLRLENRTLPGIILGDSAYAQTRYVYTPVPVPANGAEHRYNHAHILTRNVVERTFGIWKGRFRCLATSSQLSLRNTTREIAAAAVLHNIAIRERQQFVEENLPQEPDLPNPEQPRNLRGNAIRAAFIQRHFARDHV